MFDPPLGQQVTGPFDGPGDQLGEEADIEGEAAQVPFWFELAPVYIDGVGEGLEGVEGNAKAQQEFGVGQFDRPARRLGQGAQAVAEEVVILKEKEEAQIGAEAEGQPAPLSTARIALVNPLCREKVDCRRKPDEDYIARFPCHVKAIAHREEQGPLPFLRHQVIQPDHQGKEKAEWHGVKEHGD